VEMEELVGLSLKLYLFMQANDSEDCLLLSWQRGQVVTIHSAPRHLATFLDMPCVQKR